MPSSLLTTLLLHDDLVAKDWDESQHPREPAGTPGGGRFAGGGAETSGPGPATRQASREAAIAQPGPATMRANVARAAAFQPAGGDPLKLIEAARQLAARGIGTPSALAAEAGLRARVAGRNADEIAYVERHAKLVAEIEAGARARLAEPIVAQRGDIHGAGPEEKRWQYQEAVRAAGRDPAKLAQAAALGARLGLGGVKTLARGAKQQAEQAGRGLPPQHPEFKVRTPVRAQDLARSAVQHELGIQPKARAPRAPKPVMGAAPANKPPVAPAKPPESAGGAARQLSFTGTGFGHPQVGLPLHPAAAEAALPGGVDQSEHHLLTAKVTAEELRVDENNPTSNETRFVTFEDGSRGVFKPKDPASWSKPGGDQEFGDGAARHALRDHIPVGMDMQRETAAYQVAKIVGMTDMIPATVIRTFGKDEDVPPALRGRTGSVQQFVANSQPAAKQGGVWGERIISDKPPYDGSTDFARAAVFDYVMGNEDRHPGNWMVNKTSGKLQLIDHGLIVPEAKTIQAVRGFMRNAGRTGRDTYRIGDLPPVIGTPRDFAAPFIQNKDAILGVLTNLGLSNKRALGGVSARIGNIDGWNNQSDWWKMQLEASS